MDTKVFIKDVDYTFKFQTFSSKEASLLLNIKLSGHLFGNQFTFLAIKWFTYTENHLYRQSAWKRRCLDKWGSTVYDKCNFNLHTWSNLQFPIRSNSFVGSNSLGFGVSIHVVNKGTALLSLDGSTRQISKWCSNQRMLLDIRLCIFVRSSRPANINVCET